MSIPLTNLMENIGIAVQRANATIEVSAAEIYIMQGFYQNKTESNNGDEENFYDPITYTMHLPSNEENKKINVPITALMHHTTLQLDHVEIKLKFTAHEDEDGDILVDVKAPQDTKDTLGLSELSMHFKSSPSAEGTARIENRFAQSI